MQMITDADDYDCLSAEAVLQTKLKTSHNRLMILKIKEEKIQDDIKLKEKTYKEKERIHSL